MTFRIEVEISPRIWVWATNMGQPVEFKDRASAEAYVASELALKARRKRDGYAVCKSGLRVCQWENGARVA